MNKNIRLLHKNEIECRVAQIGKSQNGGWCSLLLYKDARVDMRILDEVFGSLGWEREHLLIGDRLYCTVRIYDKEKGIWINKQDVGTESNTEPEKGQASDAFKRACFNVGIGRELYSAPKIFINLNENEVQEGKNGSIKCRTFFDVASIDYSSNREIVYLVIVDSKGDVRYKFGRPRMSEAQIQKSVERLVAGDDSVWENLNKSFYLDSEDIDSIEKKIKIIENKK